jgi:glycerophosphoryl diester phosphodiesterase
VRHSFFSSSRPLVFAHRGGAALAPENTLRAFDNGLALGADGIELDVRLSSNRVAVVHHDATLDRTTTLRGPIAERHTDELAAVNVPTLRAVLLKYPHARVIIEIKDASVAIARAVTEEVRAANAGDRVCVGSFSRTPLREVRRLEPALATSAAREEVRWALYRSWCRWPVMTTPYAGYQIPEVAGSTRVVSPRFIADAHRAGLGVQVWTVNVERDAEKLLGWGVDALITDRPDLMVPLIRKMSETSSFGRSSTAQT